MTRRPLPRQEPATRTTPPSSYEESSGPATGTSADVTHADRNKHSPHASPFGRQLCHPISGARRTSTDRPHRAAPRQTRRTGVEPTTRAAC